MVSDPAGASQANSRREDALEFAEAIFPPGATGKMITAFGRDPYWDDGYKFLKENWSERTRDYPAGIGAAIDLMLKAADVNTDTYMCTGLAHKNRESASLRESHALHADWDGDEANRQACIDKVRELGGFAIDTGTEGHLQCFLPLAEPIITAARYTTLCRAFAAKLPPGADSKIAWNDMLRVPGCHSLKSTVRPGDTGKPTLVTWALKPTGARIDTIDEVLGTVQTGQSTAGESAGAAASPGPHLIAEPPGGIGCYPRVDEAIANAKLKADGTIDRSATIMSIVGACASSNLELPHARWCVELRPDVRSKIDEQGSRDDVLECWVKAVNSRQRLRRDRMTPGNPFGPNTDDGGDDLDIDLDLDQPVPKQPKLFGDVQHLEADFWERPSLATIKQAALARMCSPWAVLGIAAARALTSVPPTWSLPALIGHGSLNSFVAVVTQSGGGKNAAASVAKELLGRSIEERNLGSGEGLVKAYYPKAKKDEPINRHTSILFNVAEVDMLGALGQRNGSTLMATVRDAFSGGTLGFAYATDGKDHHLEAGTYRMTMVVGVQPRRAGILLDDEAGGTPQRFLWFPANDIRIDDVKRPKWPGVTLTLPAYDKLCYGNTNMQIPPEAEALILSNRAKNSRGEQNALDGHALFCREKFAFALAILDGRTEMTLDDWELSSIASEVSTFIRGQVVDILTMGEREQAAKAGELRGVSQAAADNEKAVILTEHKAKMLRWLLEKIDAAGGEIKNRDLKQAAGSKDRAALEMALADAQKSGLIKRVGATWKKVPK